MASPQPMHVQRSPTRIVSLASAFAVSLLATLVFPACGGDSHEGDEPGSQSSPTELQLPRGWISFTESGYTGAIHEDWILQRHIDPNQYDLSTVPEDVAAYIRDNSVKLSEEELTNFFMVFLATDGSTPASISLGKECFESAPTSRQKVLSEYKKRGISVEFMDPVVYNGKQVDVIHLGSGGPNDIYQVVLKTGKCFSGLTLVTPAGDQSYFDDLAMFVSFLRVDSSRLKVIGD